MLFIEDYGAVSGQDCTSAIQAAVNAAIAAGGAGVTSKNPGFFLVSNTITIPGAMAIVGCGGLGGTSVPGGTLFRNTSAAGHVFFVSSPGGVVFENFTIDAPGVTKAAGTFGIILSGGGTGKNTGSRLDNVVIGNMDTAILFDSAWNANITDCQFAEFRTNGIKFVQTYAVDAGQNHIRDCNFTNMNTANANAGIHYQQGGDLSVIGCKFLGAQYAIHLASIGWTGTMIIEGCSIEEQTIANLCIENWAPGTGHFGNLILKGNELSIITGNPQASIIQRASTAPWFYNMVVEGNVFNFATAVSGNLVSLADVQGGIVAHNIVNQNGHANPPWLSVGAACTNMLTTPNVVIP